MQFAEAIAPEEAQVLRRFVQTEEAEKALEAKFQVVSLPRILALGGYKKTVPDFSRFDTLEGLKTRFSHEEIPTVGMLPNLAVCSPRRVWGNEVYFRSRGRGRVAYCNSPSGLRDLVDGRGAWSKDFTVPGWENAPATQNNMEYHAPLPLLPKEARQALEQYPNGIVLWEADWDPVPVPIGDPAILVPLINELYAVAYVWDLTELEKKVLTKAFVK